MESWKKFLKEGYYKIDPTDPPSLQDIIDGWQRGDKSRGPEAKTTSGSSYHALYSVEDLLPYREYKWSSEKFRGMYDDPRKWDNLVKSIEEEGVKETLIFQVGKNGVGKVAEGNHRLAIAKELGIDKVPVKFLFFDKVELAPQSFRNEENK